MKDTTVDVQVVRRLSDSWDDAGDSLDPFDVSDSERECIMAMIWKWHLIINFIKGPSVKLSAIAQ